MQFNIGTIFLIRPALFSELVYGLVCICDEQNNFFFNEQNKNFFIFP